MELDVQSLVAPLIEDAPSGPDLSFDAERQQIEAAFERSANSDEPGAEIDWRATIKLILAQAERTRDLWLATYLIRAATLLGDFDQSVDAAEYLASLLEERWKDVHPQLEEYDFIGRKTPCESLTKVGEYLKPLAHIPLVEHERLGRYTGADFEALEKYGAKAANYGMFRALLEAEGAAPLEAVVEKFDRLANAIKRADAVLTENAQGDTSTNFEPTFAVISSLRKAVFSQIPGSAALAGATPTVAGPLANAIVSSGSSAAFSGAINSREDVIRALDAIGAYYLHSEPASPVPLVLQRAREWVTLDFLSVLEDIAPGSLEEAKRVLTSGRVANEFSAPEAYAGQEPDVSDEGKVEGESGW